MKEDGGGGERMEGLKQRDDGEGRGKRQGDETRGLNLVMLGITADLGVIARAVITYSNVVEKICVGVVSHSLLGHLVN